MRRSGLTMSPGYRSPAATSCSIGVKRMKFSRLISVTSTSARRASRLSKCIAAYSPANPPPAMTILVVFIPLPRIVTRSVRSMFYRGLHHSVFFPSFSQAYGSENFTKFRVYRRFTDELAEPVILCESLAFSDRFFHHLPPWCRQRAHPTPVEVPQAFVYVAGVKNHDAFTRVRMVERRARIFRDELKQSLFPGIVGRMENLFGELLEFFNADCSNRLRDAFTAVVVDFVDVFEFIEWHRIYSVGCGSLGCKGEALRSR